MQYWGHWNTNDLLESLWRVEWRTPCGESKVRWEVLVTCKSNFPNDFLIFFLRLSCALRSQKSYSPLIIFTSWCYRALSGEFLLPCGDESRNWHLFGSSSRGWRIGPPMVILGPHWRPLEEPLMFYFLLGWKGPWMEAGFWLCPPMSVAVTKQAGSMWDCPMFVPDAVMAYSQ